MQDIKIESLPQSRAWSLWKKHYFKYVPPLFITIILTVGQISFGMLDNYLNIVIAIGSAILTEIILASFLLGTWKNLASAYITGISVGILIRSNVIWPYAVTAILSIMSKYVLQYKGRHLWNPSNFGVSWMLFMAPLSVAGLSIQWGNNFLALAVVWILGLFIVNRAKRLHVTLTYVISFIIFAYLRSIISHDAFLAEISPLTGPMYQLFIFFMITDPPTSVSTKKGRILVVILIALVEFILRLNGFIYAPFYALFLVGPLCRFIDLRINRAQTK
jgi:enediyne biosynthesis protein E5